MHFPQRQFTQTTEAKKIPAIFHGIIRMEHRLIVSIIISAVLLFCGRLSARPTTAYEAEQVVTGWLKADFQPLGTNLGQTVSKVETFVNDDGQAIYYIVYVEPSGFIIVSTDNSIEPIIGFSDDGRFDTSPDNPLWALVHNDLNGRITANHNTDPPGTVENSDASHAPNKWSRFISLAETNEEGLSLEGISYLSDIRVIPFVKSQWGQSTACGENCFNYYCPNNYPCGCLATTMAQLMRYFEHPTMGIGQLEFYIAIDGTFETRTTLGGDQNGGPYNWSDMVLNPYFNCESLTPTQIQAIGALCYDAGIAIHMQYSAEGSGALMTDTMYALLDTFMYSNAVMGYNHGNNIGAGLHEMINPSLDAKSPVLLGIQSELYYNSGHALLCDGYGYNASTIYHHLNIGWNGVYDAWYNLPTIDVDIEYSSIISCLYNISVSGTGEFISGRVLDLDDNPIANATVFAKTGTQNTHSTVTDYKGIYALDGLNSDASYRVWVEKDGYIFSRKAIGMGFSQNGYGTSGNCWEVDFYPQIVLNPPTISPVYVNNDAPDDSGPDDTAVSDPAEDGSQEHPFDAIQEAIDIAEFEGTVIILSGTYTGEGNRDIDFKGKTITVRSTDPNDPSVVAETVIDCNGSEADPHRGFVFNNYETHQSIVAGLTITGGYNESGGAIFYGQCTAPTIINCIFKENQAYCGGSIYTFNANPKLINCEFNNNSAAAAGGALYSYVDFIECNSILEDCLFQGNTTTYNGGAIYNSGMVNALFTNCIFTENTSSGGGGAIRNTYSANTTFTNCIFSKNQAQTYGGCIRGSNDSKITITNCTFSANSASSGSSLACTADDQNGQVPSTVQIINSIIRDSGNEIWKDDESKITVTYSNVPNSQGTGPWSGQGNINADPCFAGEDNGNLHLKSQAGRYDPLTESWVIDELTSPCIDAGDTNSLIGDEPLPNGDIINMGAYGGTTEASKSLSN